MIKIEEIADLIHKLNSAVQDRKLRWIPTAEGYMTIFPRSSVVVEKAGLDSYIFRVLNQDGDTAGLIRGRAGSHGISGLIAVIYSAAQRQALAIDETLADIFTALSEKSSSESGGESCAESNNEESL